MLNCVRSRLFKTIILGVAVLCVVLLPAVGNAKQKAIVSGEDVNTIAIKAYIYAYPMMYTEATREWVDIPDNTLENVTKFSTPDSSANAPNVDTLYSDGFLNLERGPVTLTFPDMGSRYWTFNLYDYWSDDFAEIGTRTTGNSAQSVKIVGPDWPEEIPEGSVKVIRAPTTRVMVINRIWCSGTTQDVAAVNALQNEVKLSGPGVPKHSIINVDNMTYPGLIQTPV